MAKVLTNYHKLALILGSVLRPHIFSIYARYRLGYRITQYLVKPISFFRVFCFFYVFLQKFYKKVINKFKQLFTQNFIKNHKKAKKREKREIPGLRA